MISRKVIPMDESDGVYIRVKNGSSSTLTAGDVVILDATDDDGISVDLASSANNKLVAGVICETIEVGKYGKMQVYGYNGAVKVDGGTTDVPDGSLLGTSAVPGYAVATTTLGATFGVILEAADSKSTSKVFIKCM